MIRQRPTTTPRVFRYLTPRGICVEAWHLGACSLFICLFAAMRPSAAMYIRRGLCPKKMALSIICNSKQQQHQPSDQFTHKCVCISFVYLLQSVSIVPTAIFFSDFVASVFPFLPSASENFHCNVSHNENRSHHPPRCSIIRGASSPSWATLQAAHLQTAHLQPVYQTQQSRTSKG